MARLALLLALLCCSCTGCGDAGASASPAPQPPFVIYSELSDVQNQLARAAFDWINETTGLPQPEVIAGPCSDRESRCFRRVDELDTDFGTELPEPSLQICDASRSAVRIRCRPRMNVNLADAALVFRHEVAHLYLGPGHSTGTDLMADDVRKIACAGLTSEQLNELCKGRACTRRLALCD